MNPTHAFETIGLETFTSLLAQYPDVVPNKLADLDVERYETIPSKTKALVEKDRSDVYISKPELATLMKWKLSHGKFRPQLSKLIDENSVSAVKEKTGKAAQIFLSKGGTGKVHAQSNYKAAVTTLTSLRGVGPATASLVLSCLPETKAPFFSDELYRWAFFSAPGSSKADKGWDRKLKYSMNEYLTLVEKVSQLKDRLEADGTVTPVDIEKVAYVIGKRASGYAEATTKEQNENKRKELSSSSRDPPSGTNAALLSSSKRLKTNTVQGLDNSAEDSKATRRSNRKT